MYVQPDKSSHKMDQAACSLQVGSLVPTNCHLVGALFMSPASGERKVTSAGMKAFVAGKSYLGKGEDMAQEQKYKSGGWDSY